MTTFYLSLTCGNCDEEVLYGPCATTMEHRGLPVIPFDLLAQSQVLCDYCGADNYTGEFEIHSEGGEQA